MTTVLERIFGRLKQVAQSQAETGYPRYRKTLIDLAKDIDGSLGTAEKLDPDELDEMLRSMGKTRRDFDRDVKTMADRIAQREQVDQQPEATERQAALEREIEDAAYEFEQARLRHFATIEPKQLELGQVQQVIQAGERAKIALSQSCLDPSIDREADDIAAKREEVGRKKAMLEFELDPSGVNSSKRSAAYSLRLLFDRREEAINMRYTKTQPLDDMTMEEIDGKIALFEKYIADCRKELASVAKEMQKLNSQMDKVNARRLLI